MNSGLVSIITSTYNDSKFISHGIKQVLNQSYENFEFLIINDASTDDTEKIIKKFSKKDKRIHYYINKRNIGVTRSRNRMLKLARGEYVACLDGDDYWADKNKLRKQISFLQNNKEYSMVGSWAKVVSESGEMLFSIKYPVTDDRIRACSLRRNCFITSSVLMRMTHVAQVGHFNDSFETAQDYDYWLRMTRHGLVYNIPEFMVNYVQNSNGITQTKYLLQNTDTINIINLNRKYFSGYMLALVLWKIRRYYPKWLWGRFSFEVINKINEFKDGLHQQIFTK